MNLPNYNALTEGDCRQQLEWEGFLLRYNEADQLELIQFGGGGMTIHPYWERSTGECFDSAIAAHRYVFTL